jgi:hypothetical protein
MEKWYSVSVEAYSLKKRATLMVPSPLWLTGWGGGGGVVPSKTLPKSGGLLKYISK